MPSAVDLLGRASDELRFFEDTHLSVDGRLYGDDPGSDIVELSQQTYEHFIALLPEDRYHFLLRHPKLALPLLYSLPPAERTRTMGEALMVTRLERRENFPKQLPLERWLAKFSPKLTPEKNAGMISYIDLLFGALMSPLAYERGEENAGVELLNAAGFSASTFEQESVNGIYAESSEMMAFSFRGTANLQTLWADLQYSVSAASAIDQDLSGRGHKGFLRLAGFALAEVKHRVQARVAAQLSEVLTELPIPSTLSYLDEDRAHSPYAVTQTLNALLEENERRPFLIESDKQRIAEAFKLPEIFVMGHSSGEGISPLVAAATKSWLSRLTAGELLADESLSQEASIAAIGRVNNLISLQGADDIFRETLIHVRGTSAMNVGDDALWWQYNPGTELASRTAGLDNNQAPLNLGAYTLPVYFQADIFSNMPNHDSAYVPFGVPISINDRFQTVPSPDPREQQNVVRRVIEDGDPGPNRSQRMSDHGPYNAVKVLLLLAVLHEHGIITAPRLHPYHELAHYVKTKLSMNLYDRENGETDFEDASRALEAVPASDIASVLSLLSSEVRFRLYRYCQTEEGGQHQELADQLRAQDESLSSLFEIQDALLPDSLYSPYPDLRKTDIDHYDKKAFHHFLKDLLAPSGYFDPPRAAIVHLDAHTRRRLDEDEIRDEVWPRFLALQPEERREVIPFARDNLFHCLSQEELASIVFAVPNKSPLITAHWVAKVLRTRAPKTGEREKVVNGLRSLARADLWIALEELDRLGLLSTLLESDAADIDAKRISFELRAYLAKRDGYMISERPLRHNPLPG